MAPDDQNTDDNDKGGGERIAKVIARAGVCSRRDAERLIAEGRVKLNGKVLGTPAVTVTAADTIEVNGKKIGRGQQTRLWRYHKPPGLVTTHKDEQGRPTVFETLPRGLPRVISVGRLDLNSEGLLLLTNDGALSRYLELPSTGWARTYRVRTKGRIDLRGIDALKRGVTVDGVTYGSIDVRLEKDGAHRDDTGKSGVNQWMTMTLHEGKNREIRRVLGYLGLEVNRLIRLSYGPFELGDLKRGDGAEVTPKELAAALGRGFPLK